MDILPVFCDIDDFCKSFEPVWRQQQLAEPESVRRHKTNMKNKLMPIFDKIMTRKRAIVESVNDQLKNISNIEHSRRRSVASFFVNLIAGLVAYMLKEKKPSLNIRVKERLALPALVF